MADKKQFSNTKSIVKVETGIVTLISYRHYLKIVGNNKLWPDMQKESWNIHLTKILIWMGPIRNPNWSTSGMRVTLSYLSYIWSWFFPITVLYMIPILPSHYLIYDPDSSPSLSYIWSRFFPVTVLYMILILPSHCLIYDPDSFPSLFYIWSWFFPVMHCLIYDPDSSPSL